MKVERARVYEVIDGERDYQDQARGNAKREGEFAGVPLTPGEMLLTIEEIAAQARANWYKPGGDQLAAPFVRKIAAVAVQYMERYGAPERDGHTAPVPASIPPNSMV